MKNYTFDVILKDNGFHIALEEHPDVGFTMTIPNKENDQAFTWLVNNMSEVTKTSMRKLLEETKNG